MLADDEPDLFEMANLFPTTTGLRMTVWISPRGGPRHDAHIKVNMAHGPSMDISNNAVGRIRPQARLIYGNLGRADMDAVRSWIEKNEQALLDFWDGNIDTATVISLLQRSEHLPPGGRNEGLAL